MSISPMDRSLEPLLHAKIDGKAKPLGALGRIEDLALLIGLVTQSMAPALGDAAVAIFAGDHGIVAEGVTAYPSDVTGAVARMILDGVAGANIAAGAVNADVLLIDMGLTSPLPEHPRLIDRRIAAGTRNFLYEPAMTAGQVRTAFDTGAEVTRDLKDGGYGIIALGELGIGNTSAAAVLSHAITGTHLKTLVGPGAGVPAGGLDHKLTVLTKAYARAPVSDVWDALTEFGGFEIVAMAGAMIAGAQARAIVIVDGFIATAAACAAVAIAPDVRDYLVFAHLSHEPGHASLLDWIGAKPLLDLGLRLGEGTGAALAIPLIRMAAGMLADMAALP